MTIADFARTSYGRDNVLSASPARILTMLFDRLMLDLARAESAQEQKDWTAASKQLVHAQAIVAELTSSLRPELWEGGPGLLSIYHYVTRALVAANIGHDIERTRECAQLLEPLRSAWHEASSAAAPAPAAPTGQIRHYA